MKTKEEQAEVTDSKEQFLLFQKERQDAPKGKKKLALSIVFFVFAVLLLGALVVGFLCPSWLFGVLPPKFYYSLAGWKCFRQASFLEDAADAAYSASVSLEGTWNGDFSVFFRQDEPLCSLDFSASDLKLFSILVDTKEHKAYLQIPALREEPGVFSLPALEETPPPSFFEKLFPKCGRLLTSPSKVYYETLMDESGGQTRYLTAAYEKEALSLLPEELGLLQGMGIPPELAVFALESIPDGESLTVRISFELTELQLTCGNQSAILLNLQREDAPASLSLPEESVDLSDGWEAYLTGIFESGEGLEVFEELINQQEEWQDLAQPVDLTMTKISVKKQKFGLPWSYKNLPDGLPELPETLMLPGEILDFSFPELGVKGKIKNYGDVPETPQNCDVIELEVTDEKWEMTVNGVGIGTSEKSLKQLLGEASYTEQIAVGNWYRYWDPAHQILLEFLVDQGRVIRLCYRILE